MRAGRKGGVQQTIRGLCVLVLLLVLRVRSAKSAEVSESETQLKR